VTVPRTPDNKRRIRCPHCDKRLYIVPAAEAKNWKCCHCDHLFQIPADDVFRDPLQPSPTDGTEPLPEEQELRSPTELLLEVTMLAENIRRQEESRSTCMMALGLFAIFAFLNDQNPIDYGMQLLDEV